MEQKGFADAAEGLRWGGFLDNIEQFDAAFFGVSPREAAHIDPQQRLLLEVSWEALEDAGQRLDRLRGSPTGVFVGIATSDYGHRFASRAAGLDPYWITGNSGSISANRLSYFYDFKGPSLAVDTVCSSSLVAAHLACQSLRSGESALAVVCGVNVILSPAIAIGFARAGGLAPDGRCKAFDARANGMVRSEGAGAAVLKSPSQALADGDRIYAVIRGGAVNQDGRSNGITAPNQGAQEEVLRQAYAEAGISPGKVQYVETHGAGTLLGDVIEVNALNAVLAEGRPSIDRCALGSVKTNVGHCEVAAGLAGLIKVALAEAWKQWGVRPDAVVGHSMGEVAAACVAGALDLPEALRVILSRSRLLQQALEEAPPGTGMAAVRISACQVEEQLHGYEDRVSVAVYNSPKYTVLAGQVEALQEIIQSLRRQKIGGRMMNVPGAAHTSTLEPMRLRLSQQLDDIRPRRTAVPFYSTVTGRAHDGSHLDGAYWGNNLRQTVLFAPAVDRLIDDDYRLFLEIGPHPLLTAAIEQCLLNRDLKSDSPRFAWNVRPGLRTIRSKPA